MRPTIANSLAIYSLIEILRFAGSGIIRVLSSAAAGTQAGARVRHRIKDRYLDELNEDVEGIVTRCGSLSDRASADDPLLMRSRKVTDYLPENEQVIVAPEPLKNSSPAYDDDDLLLSSLYMDINVLLGSLLTSF